MSERAAARGERKKSGNVVEIGFTGDDAALVRALESGHPGAPAALFDRHAPHVRRMLVRLLGHDSELADLLHEVFARALKNVGQLREPARLRQWLVGVAVHTARGHIRARARRRWLRLSSDDTMPEPQVPGIDPAAIEAMQCTYAVLQRLPADQRIAFALRFIADLELKDVAEACGVSLATIKRRLARAEKRFVTLARREPPLEPWLAASERWRSSEDDRP